MTPELATATDRLDAAIERVGNLNRQLSAAIVALADAMNDYNEILSAQENQETRKEG